MIRPFIMVAPNGARRGKVDHPALPITTEEIVATAAACHACGANGLHLHVRDPAGEHSLDAGRYRETLDALHRHVPQLRVQITTEAAGRFDVPAQLACLRDVQPAWASIAVREIARARSGTHGLRHVCGQRHRGAAHRLRRGRRPAIVRLARARGCSRRSRQRVVRVGALPRRPDLVARRSCALARGAARRGTLDGVCVRRARARMSG